MPELAHLDERRAQAVMLVRAFEEADPEARWLPREERRRATAEALAEGPAPSAPAASAKVAALRAERLLPGLDALAPMLPRVRRVTRLGVGLGLPVAALSLLVGASSSALGPARHVNLLSVPLLAAIGWNLLMYLGFVLVWLLRGRKAAPGQGFARLVAPLATLTVVRRAVSRLRGESPDKAAYVGRATSAYLRAWRGAATPLVEARARRLMHLAALALVVGMVAGMYARGLIFEYRATWESTFLDATEAHRLLETLFTPAATVFALEVPSRAAVAAMEAPGEGPAAPWIHLYAASALLLVVLPRGLLIVVEALRALRLSRRLPIDVAGAYYRRVLAAGRGDRRRVELIPYSLQPSPRLLDALQTALLDLFGSRAALRRHAPLDYGDPPPDPPEGHDGAACAVLFNAAQTPEEEVHGDFLERLRRELAWDEPVLAIVDQSRYRRRLGEGAEAAARLAERRRAWDRVAREARVPIAHVDLEAASAAETHALLNAALEASKESR